LGSTFSGLGPTNGITRFGKGFPRHWLSGEQRASTVPFFRSAYGRTGHPARPWRRKRRTVSDRRGTRHTAGKHIEGALHPKSLACYLDAGDGNLVAECGPVAESPTQFQRHRSAEVSFPLWGNLRSARVGHNSSHAANAQEIAHAEKPGRPQVTRRPAIWAACAGMPGALLGRNSGLIGLLVLGQRLSEEPYSGEDKPFARFSGGQAGITLENIRLAEKMAERMEADRRVDREMEIARELQARLFPQKLPAMKTLEYIGG